MSFALCFIYIHGFLFVISSTKILLLGIDCMVWENSASCFKFVTFQWCGSRDALTPLLILWRGNMRTRG